jgi:large subunit ribosomal protein L24
MKKKFSTHWKSSKQPRKQRKYLAQAPLHTKHKFLSANLSKALREKYGKRALPLRKGDEVLIMRGSSRKKKAKVISVEPKKTRVVLEGIQRTKKDGTKVSIPFHPSTLQIQALNLDDKKRSDALDRSQNKKSSSKESQTKSEEKKEKQNAPKKTNN